MNGDVLFPTSVVGSLPRPQFVKDLIADDAPFDGRRVSPADGRGDSRRGRPAGSCRAGRDHRRRVVAEESTSA